jgi:hypothetical protein
MAFYKFSLIAFFPTIVYFALRSITIYTFEEWKCDNYIITAGWTFEFIALKVVLSTLAFTAFELPPNGAIGTKILEFLFHSRPDLVSALIYVFSIHVAYDHQAIL